MEITDREKKQAQAVFANLCERLDEHKWKYDRDDDNLTISCGVHGDDLPISLRIKVDATRKLITIMSPMPFDVPQNKRVAMAIAINQANNYMLDGSFDFNFMDGKILFRMTSSYRESLIGKQVFTYMISIACHTIDEYNDKFLTLTKKDMSVEEILKYMK